MIEKKTIIDSKNYREGMSRVAGAVHIITTGGEAGKAGFTATAVTSVSDSPPTVLVCLNSDSRSLAVIENNKTFCINTLAAHHEALADVFAGRSGVFGASRFDHGTWEYKAWEYNSQANAQSNPILSDALVNFSCRVTSITSVATHVVILGEVEHVTLGTKEPALAYLSRRYVVI